MSRYWFQGRRTRTGAAALAVLLMGGCAGTEPARYTVSPGLSVFEHTAGDAEPTAAAPTPSPAPGQTPGTDASTSKEAGTPAVLGPAEPTTVTIGALGLTREVIDLGLRENGTVEVPPEAPGSPAGWYTGSPTPGEQGPSVVLGHVNATGGGPGVFARLAELTEGDTVEIAREDNAVAVFGIEKTVRYAKGEFPTLQVHSNTTGAELRLITCDGYDPDTGLFEENLVLYATLTTQR